MIIATLQFELLIHGAESLKDKRRVVKSVKDRLHREHMVSVAEVGSLESHTVAVMGLAAAGTDGRVLAGVLDRITEKLRALTDAELGAAVRQIVKPDFEEAAASSEIDADDLAAEMLRHAETGEGGSA